MQDTNKYKLKMSEIRSRISESKRKNTKKGSIGYYECMDICKTFFDIIDETEELTENEEYYLAFSIATLIQINNAKLASKGDSSSGCVSDVQSSTVELMNRICISAKSAADDSIKTDIFSKALKDSKNSSFDDWEDFCYEILQSAAILSNNKNITSLYDTLNEISEKYKSHSYSVYKDWDGLVRFTAIRAAVGDGEADKFADNDPENDMVRKATAEMAIENKNYVRAESLCTEMINKLGKYSYHLNEWYDLLMEVYKKSENDDALMDLVYERLIKNHEAKYYSDYKELLVKQQKWDSCKSQLFSELEHALSYEALAAIYWKENEIQSLLDIIKNYPSIALAYTQKLGNQYSDVTYPICISEFEKNAQNASKRPHYKRVCSDLKSFHKCGAETETLNLIKEFKEKYPRRTAFVDELCKLENQLKKRK